MLFILFEQALSSYLIMVKEIAEKAQTTGYM